MDHAILCHPFGIWIHARDFYNRYIPSGFGLVYLIFYNRCIPSGFGFVCSISIIVASLRDLDSCIWFSTIVASLRDLNVVSCFMSLRATLLFFVAKQSPRGKGLLRRLRFVCARYHSLRSARASSQRHYASSNFHNSRISWLVTSNSSSVPSDSTLPSFSTMM